LLPNPLAETWYKSRLLQFCCVLLKDKRAVPSTCATHPNGRVEISNGVYNGLKVQTDANDSARQRLGA
jgi:hypothetical protein